MKASDWKYSAEGGQHALFEFVGSSTVDDSDNDSDNDYNWRYKGKLLRFDKKYLAQSTTASMTPPPPPTTTTTNMLQEEKHLDHNHFIRKVVQPHFGSSYVDEVEILSLPWWFVHELRQHALPFVPLERLADWSCQTQPRITTDTTVTASLIWDYRYYCDASTASSSLLQQQPTTTTSKTTWSVEIKPKAGYCAISPLVHPSHRRKFFMTRLYRMQTLMLHGYLKQKHNLWNQVNNNNNNTTDAATTATSTTTLKQTTSDDFYNPLDLFSNHQDRIQKAVRTMFSNHANFCRIHHDTENDSHTYIPNNGEQIVSTILYQERGFLSKILSFQRLDIIDGDGALLIYQRMLQLCQQNVSQVMTLLKSYSFSVDTTKTEPETPSPIPVLLKASPLAFDSTATNNNNNNNNNSPLLRLLQLIQTFQETSLVQMKTSWEDPGIPHDAHHQHQQHDQHQQAYQQAFDLVQQLSLQECQYLLQNWLLSLTFCDVSFFITIKSSSSSSTQQDHHQDHHHFDYQIKLIDCQQIKPPSKLQTRSPKESIFQSMPFET